MTTEEDTTFDDIMSALNEAHGKTNVCKTFQLKGIRYKLPQLDTESEYKLGNMTVSLNGYSLETNKNNQVLFSNGNTEQKIQLECKYNDWTPGTMGYNRVFVFLFKEGAEEPVSAADGLFYDEGNISLEMKTGKTLLDPGKYFIYLPYAKTKDEVSGICKRINKGLCYSFDIYALGKETDCPQLIKAKAASENEQHKLGRLKLAIELAGNIKETCELSVLCYDDQYSLMSRTDKIVTPKSAASRRISFYLESEKIWEAGSYHLVVSMNRFPFAQIEINASNFSQMSCETKPLQTNDDLHWIVSSLEYGKRKDWDIVREFRGLKKDKFKIARLLQSYLIKQEKGQKRDSDLIVIESDSTLHSKFMAFALRHLFLIGRKSFKMINLNPNEQGKKETENNAMEWFLKSRANNAFSFTHINALLSPSNRPILSDIVEALEHLDEQTTVVFCCTHVHLKTLSTFFPRIKEFVKESQIIHLEEITPSEMLNKILSLFKEKQCCLTDKAQEVLMKSLRDCWVRDGVKYINTEEASDWVRHTIENMCVRCNLHSWGDTNTIYTIDAPDIDLEDYFRQNTPQENVQMIDKQTMQKDFKRAMTELNNMTGLNNLKNNLERTFKKVMFSKQREMLGLPVCEEPPHHMIFSGNPGTGKTSVAKLMGKVYKSMGLLSKGDVIVTERHKLVGQYIGETEQKMASLLEEAKGKVLFIDEAYNLFTAKDDCKDYGNQVVNSLLTTLSQPHADMVIILAGYADDMERLLSKNHGLKSRFSHHFTFEDYTSDELYEIAEKELANGFYSLTTDAQTCLKATIHRVVENKQKDFGNARWVLQFVNNGILSAMANRVIESEDPCSIELYSQITKEDVMKAAATFAKQSEPKNSGRMGFVR